MSNSLSVLKSGRLDLIYGARTKVQKLLLTALLSALLAGCSVTTRDNGIVRESGRNKPKTSSANSVMNFMPASAGEVKRNDSNKDNLKQKYAQQNAKAEPDQDRKMPSLADAVNKPLTPEQTEELLDEVGSNWLYGQGMGETALTVGAIAIFPPYALAVLGNAALQVSGEEPVGISTVLPEEAAESWTEFYDGVTSVPGRGVAYVSDEEFRDKEIARERILSVLNKSK